MTTTIVPTESHSAQDIARRLLDAADSPDDVTTDTSGRSVAFVVSDELAEKAGFSADDSDVVELPDTDAAGQDETPLLGDTDETPTAPPAADSPDDVLDVDEPPRGGKGSGGQVWFDFLNDQNVEIPNGLTAEDRDELVAVWDAHLDTQG
ncbi:hypothetical protein CH276_22750 [Rhodococcus sp. 06-470-2]|uniref:hypothetical protein n=1 Tax=unclassified Rhodococcus (in: high G+C Gram-positive bacteria) TaxID=192944 RepID=UPI000B9C665F|nr:MULTISPECIES: hypothetical protein [unclassified Rhodococcus (in: high G+C Gram-positive bacteria)]OZC59269.1 hypothetical protein CH276_22750 [Rhodococcus sp. 06-470-2]OZE63627.1 hypothetical protein CH265_12180 [Rhodococcus sp. 05-2221-1B]